MAAAIGGVESPICGADVVSGREAESAGGAVNRGRSAFELEEGADGGLVEVEVKGVEAEAGAILFVAEAWTEA